MLVGVEQRRYLRDRVRAVRGQCIATKKPSGVALVKRFPLLKGNCLCWLQARVKLRLRLGKHRSSNLHVVPIVLANFKRLARGLFSGR